MNRLYQIIDVFLASSKRIYAYLGIFGILFALNPLLYAGNLADSMAQLDKISVTLKNLEKEIASDQLTRKKLSAELVNLDKQTSQLHQELAGFEQRRRVIDQNLIQLQKDKAKLGDQLHEQNDSLQRQIRLAYLSNQQPAWQNLLNNSGIQGLAARKQMYAYVNGARLAEIKNINDLAENLQQTEQELSKQQQALANLIALKAEQQAILKQARQQKDRAQSALNNRLQDTKERLKAEKKQQQEVQKLVKKLTKAKPAITVGGFHKAKGNMPWPVYGEIQNRFGNTKEQNSDATWEGIATAANRGTEIHAIYHGQVIFADYLQGYGWLLILDHGDEFMSLYAHAETLGKELGDSVASNEVIGLVGDSGNVTKPTLYFEIRRQGAPVNPRAWCKSVQLTYAE